MSIAKFFKVLVFSLPLFALAEAASASHECEVSCSDRCVALVAEWEHIVQSHNDYCSGAVTCVPNCTDRWSDGSCKTYGADYCGRNPVCVKKCADRWSDGSCKDWTADLCGEQPLNCAVRCVARWSDGSCKEYGEDYCGRNAACQAYCAARWPDGSCKEYGPDVCRP